MIRLIKRRLPFHNARRAFLTLSLAALAGAASGQSRPQVIEFNDDGAWSWFQDERAIAHNGKLIIGSVAAGAHNPLRRGDIEVVTYDIATGEKTRSELHDRLLTGGGAYDDHNSPALLVRPDGLILAVYSMHGPENRFYYRVSVQPHDSREWQAVRQFIPSQTSRITYSNLHYLSAENGGKGRLYNFYRGLDNSFKPSYAISHDQGETWISGNVYIDVPGPFRHRPYVKYASNGKDTVHMFYTEGHPSNFDNSTYHVYYRDGILHASDGTRIAGISQGLKNPDEGTRVFQGDANNVAWVSDMHLDSRGRPYVAFTIQKDSAGLPRKQGGEDLRYRYGRWDGAKWQTWEIAYAGRRLYAGEDDYTGNIALDPDDPNTVYISTDVEPSSGKPLIGNTDNRRHYEIFQGLTKDGGRTWRWIPLTADSAFDNIRPVMPKRHRGKTALIWLQGAYRAYTEYDLKVVGILK